MPRLELIQRRGIFMASLAHAAAASLQNCVARFCLGIMRIHVCLKQSRAFRHSSKHSSSDAGARDAKKAKMVYFGGEPAQQGKQQKKHVRPFDFFFLVDSFMNGFMAERILQFFLS